MLCLISQKWAALQTPAQGSFELCGSRSAGIKAASVNHKAVPSEKLIHVQVYRKTYTQMRYQKVFSNLLKFFNHY